MQARSPIFNDSDNQPYGKTEDEKIFIYAATKKAGKATFESPKKYQIVNGRACHAGTEKRIFFIPSTNPATKQPQIDYSFFISRADVTDLKNLKSDHFKPVQIQNSLECPFNKPQQIKLDLIQEVILVVGAEQHKQTKGMKLVFPAQAVREIRENKDVWKNDIVTLILFTHGYTPDELKVATDAARSFHPGTNVRRIDSTDKLINYINTGDVDNKKERSTAIKTLFVFSHGYPSKITFNMDGKDQQHSEFDSSHVARLQKSAFSKSAEFYSYACRSGSISDLVVIDAKKWREIVKPENSLAQKLADHLGIKVFAFVIRTQYGPTWDDCGDLAFRKKFVDLKDKSVDITLWKPKTWDDYDEALWNPDGAKGKPTGGDTPIGPPNTMFTFERGTSPY